MDSFKDDVNELENVDNGMLAVEIIWTVFLLLAPESKQFDLDAILSTSSNIVVAANSLLLSRDEVKLDIGIVKRSDMEISPTTLCNSIDGVEFDKLVSNDHGESQKQPGKTFQ